jgi:hypothetical protein
MRVPTHEGLLRSRARQESPLLAGKPAAGQRTRHSIYRFHYLRLDRSLRNSTIRHPDGGRDPGLNANSVHETKRSRTAGKLLLHRRMNEE